jgi:hypothetical protein
MIKDKDRQILIDLGFSLLAVTVLILFLFTACEKEVPWSHIYDQGSGTPEDPWLISNAAQFDNIRNILNGNFRLVANIDLQSHTADTGWMPIGNSEAGFTGILDGNGHSITGIVKSGIFGFTAEGSVIKNLFLESVNITEGFKYFFQHTTGTLVDLNEGEILNCSVTGIVTCVVNVSFGGLVGINRGNIVDCNVDVDISECGSMGGITDINYGYITGCHTYGTITNHQSSFVAGGICVLNFGNISESKASVDISGSWSYERSAGGFVAKNSGTITRSYSTGNIELIIRRPEMWQGFADTGAGGFTGTSPDAGSFRDCYATGNVSVTFDYDPKYFRVFTGGFSGTGGNISNCYSVGKVSGDDSGGLVGGEVEGVVSTRAIVASSYYNTETSGQNDDGKGIPKTTAEMMQQATFKGWDFDNIWTIDEGSSYPSLRWQK